ncbi:MAG TPA: hypothetical protein VGN54_03495 [Mycobacteriales bacterium]|jgi:hypothetical protein|nr:hypothetical protein [Mycobacteriales bacterium]
MNDQHEVLAERVQVLRAAGQRAAVTVRVGTRSPQRLVRRLRRR